MKTNSISPLSFQKTLKANCIVLKDKKIHPCSIYKLDNPNDNEYIEDLKINDTHWKYSYERDELEKRMLYQSKKPTVYVMEDRQGNCLGFVDVTKKHSSNKINSFGIRPDCSGLYCKDKSIEYVGETLLSFLIQQTKKEGKHAITSQYASKDIVEFLKANNFELKSNKRDILIMPEREFYTTIQRSSQKTGSGIDFTA